MLAEKVATRFLGSGPLEAPIKSLRSWVAGFPGVLRLAERNARDIPKGWVWRSDVARFFAGFDDIDTEALNLPREAQVTSALARFQFMLRSDGSEDIAYSVPVMEAWYRAFQRAIRTV